MVETRFFHIDDEQKLAFSQVIGSKNRKMFPRKLKDMKGGKYYL